MVHTQSDELRCNHNTLVGRHWWTDRVAITPRSTCTCQFQVGHGQDVSEGWTRNDLVKWLSEKGCWMNSSWTSGLKRSNMKKTKSVRNMNKPWSWKVTQGEKLSEEQPQCESESRLETKLAALPHHFTPKTANNNAQTLQATHSGQPCKMIQPSHHPQWRRNMRFLMCPSMTWNTVPLGGHAHSHKFQLTAPPSQHLIEQTRTTTGRNSVALATPTLRRLHREKNQRGSRHVTLRQRSARWAHHQRLQWRNTPTNKPNEPEARIENMILRHDFWSRPLREQPPCKNLSIPTAPTLDLADYSTQKIQTHRSKQFEFYKLRMIRGSWKTTSSRSAETKRDIKQLAQHIAHTQSDELRCNHNTLMGLNWWTRCKANTPWRTCTCQFQLGHREDVSEGWTRNDLVTWLSEKGCWMKSSLTSELKQTNMKKTQSVRNMNKPWSWKVTQGEKLSEEQPQCETEGRHTISPRKRQTATHRHFMHNTLRPTLQIYSTFTAPSLTKKHVFPFVSQHDMKSTWWTRPLPHNSTYCASVTTLDWTSTNNNWQTLCCT